GRAHQHEARLGGRRIVAALAAAQAKHLDPGADHQVGMGALVEGRLRAPRGDALVERGLVVGPAGDRQQHQHCGAKEEAFHVVARENTAHYNTAMSGLPDPIAFELFKNSVFSIADEMALTVLRTTYSGVLKDNMDYSTGFADADGKLAAQGLTLPAPLGSGPTAMEAAMRHYRDDMHPGDVFIMNDPFDGGMHLPDIFVFKPLYHDGRRLAFAATVCHHTDVGGRVAGSNASDSTEIYAEGLRIAPLKLYDAGKLNQTLMTMIEKNVRLPVQVFADFGAHLGPGQLE